MKRMRNKYNIYVVLVLITLVIGLSGCKSSHSIKKEAVNREEISIRGNNTKLSKNQKKIVDEALSWIGTPYGYGEESKGKATDCSGLVMVVFDKMLDCKLPRTSYHQSEFCHKIKSSEVRAGDLVFFATGKDPHRVSHVGIMIDSDRFVHASSSKGVVISDMGNNYYKKHFIKYGRVPCLK